MDARDKKQEEIVQNYLEKNLLKATIVSATGTGKSYIALKILENLKPAKILILVNSIDLKDTTWRDEFYKFGLKDLFDTCVIMQTYQYMYKQEKDPYNLHLEKSSLVILDECDFISSTDKLSNVMSIYRHFKVLGLTGFITKNKQDWFESHLPVIETYTAKQAQEDGLLNNIKFIFVKYDLSKDPNGLKVNYIKSGEKKSFMQSENDAYNYRHNVFAKLVAKKEILNKSFRDGNITMQELISKEKSISYLIRFATNERSKLLFNSISSSNMAKKILNWIDTEKKEEYKLVVFSRRTAQSEKICGPKNIYNGKIPKKKGKEVFDNFISGKIKVLGVCDKINRGVNIPGLNTALFESFYGSDTQAVQRLGRLLRLHPNEKATVFIFLPYFMYKHKDGSYSNKETQQVVWARKMLRSTSVKFHEIWDYRAINKK